MENLVKHEKTFYLFIILSIFIGYAIGNLCGSLLQSSRIGVSGNDGLHRTEYIDKSTITEQNNRVEETTTTIRRTNQDIGTTADSLEELLRKQRQLLDGAKQALRGAVRVDEETTK